MHPSAYGRSQRLAIEGTSDRARAWAFHGPPRRRDLGGLRARAIRFDRAPAEEATGVPEAGGDGSNAGETTPRAPTAGRRSERARREDALFSGLALASSGPEPLDARPSSPTIGGAPRTRRERAARGASLGTSGATKIAAGAGSTRRMVCSKKDSEVQTSVRTRRRPRRPRTRESALVDTRGLARTARERAVTRASPAKTSDHDAGASHHAVPTTARRGSIERAQAASGASPIRCASAGSGFPRMRARRFEHGRQGARRVDAPPLNRGGEVALLARG